MTEEELRALPIVVDLMTSARALGISKNEAYILAQRGEYPVPFYKIGRSYRVRKMDLLAFLGLAPETAPNG